MDKKQRRPTGAAAEDAALGAALERVNDSNLPLLDGDPFELSLAASAAANALREALPYEEAVDEEEGA